MTLNRLPILLFTAITLMAFVPKEELTKSLIKYNWNSNIYVYKLNVGDTLKLTSINSRGDLKFKKNGTFKGWELYGVCGNISKIEKLFIKNPKWEKQGEWELIENNKMILNLGGDYEVLILELLEMKNGYFEFIVSEKKTPANKVHSY